MSAIAILHHPECADAAATCLVHFAGLRRVDGHRITVRSVDDSDDAPDVLVVLLSPGLAAWWLDKGGAHARLTVPVLVRSCALPPDLATMKLATQRHHDSLPRPIEERADNHQDEAWTEVTREVRRAIGGGK